MPPLSASGSIPSTPDEIRAAKDTIYQQVVATQVMPLGNLTEMTEEERETIGRWIAQQ